MEHPQTGTYGIYYAITKWNYYLQGSDVIMHNDHKPLQKFLNGNCWTVELATYNITSKRISSTCNKAGDYLSRLVEVP